MSRIPPQQEKGSQHADKAKAKADLNMTMNMNMIAPSSEYQPTSSGSFQPYPYAHAHAHAHPHPYLPQEPAPYLLPDSHSQHHDLTARTALGSSYSLGFDRPGKSKDVGGAMEYGSASIYDPPRGSYSRSSVGSAGRTDGDSQ